MAGELHPEELVEGEQVRAGDRVGLRGGELRMMIFCEGEDGRDGVGVAGPSEARRCARPSVARASPGGTGDGGGGVVCLLPGWLTVCLAASLTGGLEGSRGGSGSG